MADDIIAGDVIASDVMAGEQVAGDITAKDLTASSDSELTQKLPSDIVADLVEYIVCGLVSDVDAVSLDVIDSEDGTQIEVSCAEQDAGRVIGKHGRTIKAIRTLTRALGSRVGTSVEVDVKG